MSREIKIKEVVEKWAIRYICPSSDVPQTPYEINAVKSLIDSGNELIRNVDFIMARFEGKHCGDPCIYCNTPHDDVAIGNCMGNSEDRLGRVTTVDMQEREKTRQKLIAILKSLKAPKKVFELLSNLEELAHQDGIDIGSYG